MSFKADMNIGDVFDIDLWYDFSYVLSMSYSSRNPAGYKWYFIFNILASQTYIQRTTFFSLLLWKSAFTIG